MRLADYLGLADRGQVLSDGSSTVDSANGWTVRSAARLLARRGGCLLRGCGQRLTETGLHLVNRDAISKAPLLRKGAVRCLSTIKRAAGSRRPGILYRNRLLLAYSRVALNLLSMRSTRRSLSAGRTALVGRARSRRWR